MTSEASKLFHFTTVIAVCIGVFVRRKVSRSINRGDRQPALSWHLLTC